MCNHPSWIPQKTNQKKLIVTKEEKVRNNLTHLSILFSVNTLSTPEVNIQSSVYFGIRIILIFNIDKQSEG